MDVLSVAILAAAGVAAGLINVLVGSGSLFTFPVLLWLGFPPVSANVANTIGLMVGNISGTIGYRSQLCGQGSKLWTLSAVTFTGAIAGALLILRLPSSIFEFIVPYLIGLGCILVIAQPSVTQLRQRRIPRQRGGRIAAHVLISATGVYGGYFGAAQGVLIMGVLGLTLQNTMQENNALKNLLQTVAGIAATIVFVLFGPLEWQPILIIAASSIVGGFFGSLLGPRLSPTVLRVLVVAVSVAAIVALSV